jgi:carboxyl-terminal processing protease
MICTKRRNNSRISYFLVSLIILSIFLVMPGNSTSMTLEDAGKLFADVLGVVEKNYVDRIYVDVSTGSVLDRTDKGKILYWKVDVGDMVFKGDGLAEIQFNGDHLNLPSPISGIVQSISAVPETEIGPQEKLIRIERDFFMAAMRGMVRQLDDDYSSFMTPPEILELNTATQGSFGGLGIVIGLRDGWLTVISPIEDTPAYRVGLQIGDKIVKIDGQSTKDITVMKAVQKLRGPRGTPVVVSIAREEEPTIKDYSIVRDIIKLKSVKYYLFPEKIGYLRITDFGSSTGRDLESALNDLENQGMRGLLLDLRFNPGGLLRAAIEVSDKFLPKTAVIVSTKGRGEENVFPYTSRNKPHRNYPIVLLVNEGSASASEIVGGALQDHKRAVLVGPMNRTTFGKGSVQSVIDLRGRTLPEGYSLRLTTAYYYTPNGRLLHRTKDGGGLEPDLMVDVPRDQRYKLRVQNRLGYMNEEVEKIIKEIEEQKQEESKANGEEPPAPSEQGKTEDGEQGTEEGGNIELDDLNLSWTHTDENNEKLLYDRELQYAYDNLKAILKIIGLRPETETASLPEVGL